MNAVSAAARAAVNAQRVADGLSPLPVGVSADAVAGELARRAAARDARTREVTRGLVLDADVLAALGVTVTDARALDADSFYVPRGESRPVHREETVRHSRVHAAHPVVGYSGNGIARTERVGKLLTDRASAVPVPAAIVGAGDALADRMMVNVEWDDTVTQYLSNVRIGATLRKRLADKNGRTVSESDILSDGVSSIDDIRQDAYVRAAALWSDLALRADVDGSGVVRVELGDLRERAVVTAYVVSRPMPCRDCDACVERIARAQASFDAGTRRSPFIGKWLTVNVDGTMPCDSPRYVDDAVTPRVAVSRSIEQTIQSAIDAQGGKRAAREGQFSHASMDGDEMLRADVARVAPDAFALPGVSDGLASLATAVTGAVLAAGGDVTAGSGRTGAGSAGVSADAWRVLCALLGHADTDSGRRKVRGKLADVRAGKVELSSLLATIGGTTLTV